MKSDAKLFSSRLKLALQEAGYEPRPVILEREFNQCYWGRSVSVQAIRRWLVGEVIPTQDKLQALAEWLEVDPHWLRFGEELTGSVKQQRKRWDANMNPHDRQIIETFMSLPADKRNMLGEIVFALASVYISNSN